MELARFLQHILCAIALFAAINYGDATKGGVRSEDMDNVFRSMLGGKKVHNKTIKRRDPPTQPTYFDPSAMNVFGGDDEEGESDATEKDRGDDVPLVDEDDGELESHETLKDVKPHHPKEMEEDSDDTDLDDSEEEVGNRSLPAGKKKHVKDTNFKTLDEILLGMKDKPVNLKAKKPKKDGDDEKSLEDALDVTDNELVNVVEEQHLDEDDDHAEGEEEEEEDEEEVETEKVGKSSKKGSGKGRKRSNDFFGDEESLFPSSIGDIFPSDIKGHHRFGSLGVEGELRRLNEENRRLKEDVYRSYNERMYRPEVDVTDAEGRLNPGLAAAMRYLGSGYDIIYGNPLGDPVIMVDPGYRHPVLKLDWTEKYYNHDGANMKEPRGGWIRPELSCRQAESVDHINTMEDYKKELAVDAKLGAEMPLYFSFSASAGYKNMVRTLSTNETKSYILKTYCLRYVAGIQDFVNVEPNPAFAYDVESLPSKFQEGECPVEVYRNDSEDERCSSVVRPWMHFFQKYGTHFTTIIHLGGKVTNQIQVNKSEVAKLQKDGFNIDLMIKSGSVLPVSGSAGFSMNNEQQSANKEASLKSEKLVIVIGGDVPTDGTDKVSMLEWTKSLYRKPMPIKVNIESIKTLIDNADKQGSFDRALKYYAEAYGVSPEELYLREGRQVGIATMARRGTSVTYSGTAGGSAVCPNGKVIMMGFSLVVTSSRATVFSKPEYTMSMTPCPVGQEKCIVSQPPANSEVRIWILCGAESIPLLIQETKVANEYAATAQCPEDYTIAFGVGLSMPRGAKLTATDAYGCRSGQPSCTQASPKSQYNAVWIACVEKNVPEVDSIVNQATVSLSEGCSKTLPETITDNNCPVGYSFISGWRMNHSTDGYPQGMNMIEFCSPAGSGCPFRKELFKDINGKCRSQHSWISCVKTEVVDAQLKRMEEERQRAAAKAAAATNVSPATTPKQ
ncbi:perforin PLP1, putative [Babesia ovis]|uniref:Perforin PLP1, putative n=1 Tax=Babesia ovis TaxID=5869 RepID=A0A9W5TE83_BABOV|nr:perforin PLP1, putative [Babesia ovis]